MGKPVGETSSRNEVDAKTKKWFGDAEPEIIRRVEEVAKRKGCSMASVATAWVIRKGCCPIVGLTSVRRVEQIMESLSVELNDEECAYLEGEYKPRAVQAM